MTWLLTPNRQSFTGNPGWLVSAYPGGGVRGADVPPTGSNGHASPVYNDLSLPADNDKEYAWQIVSAPAGGGTFTPYEDGSFYYLGPATSFTYQLYEAYQPIGPVTPVNINVAVPTLSGAAALDDLGATGTFIPSTVAVPTLSGAAPLDNLGATGTFIPSVGPIPTLSGAAPLDNLGATGTFIPSTGPVTPGIILGTGNSTRHSLKPLVPATQAPVTLAEAKVHLRIDDAYDDLRIEMFALAATDMAEQNAGRSIMPQTWQLTHDEFPWMFELTRTRVINVVSLTYVDPDGFQQILPPSTYALDNSDDYGSAYVVPALGTAWPLAAVQMNSVVLRYQAGYNSVAEVPPGVKAWVLLMLRDLIDGCEIKIVNGVPSLGHADRLLDSIRVY